VICVSKRVLERQLEYGVPRERLALIHNGVDLDRFAGADAQVAYDALGLPSGTPLVLFCSRLAPQKRPLDAVRAFAALGRRSPDAHMAVVGDGPMAGAVAEEVERLGLAGRIHLVGYRFDVQHWLAAATVWFLPTEAEAFSVALLEAMAAGRAILTTACAGNEELVVGGSNAVLTPVGDVAAMTRALATLLADEPARRRLGEAARRHVAGYSLDDMVARHLECYEAALAAREARRAVARRVALASRTALAETLALAITLVGPFLP
jgi:glycosyltransferase involved in cell wall biosynthesis